MRCGSHAETTTGAVISVPSRRATPLARVPSQSTASTVLSVRSSPPWWVKAARNASVSAPLPPAGRPTPPTWRIAYDSAPSPVPGRSGLTPHTIGPATRPVPSRASWEKNERMTDAALRRLQRSTVDAPDIRRRTATRVNPAAVGGSVAAARISSAAGRAART